MNLSPIIYLNRCVFVITMHSPTKRKRDEEQKRTTQTSRMTPQKHNKEELKPKNRLETVSQKTTWELKTLLFTRNLTLNSDAEFSLIETFNSNSSPFKVLFPNTIRHPRV